MGRLAVKDSNDKRPFKPQIYKSRGSYPQDLNRTYNQRNYENRSRLGSRSDSRNRGQYGNNRPRFQQNYRGNNFQENIRDMEDKTVEEITEIIGMTVTIEVEIDQEKDHSQEIMAIIGIEVQVIVDQDLDLQLVLIETE